MKRTEMSNLDTPNLEKNFSKNFEKPLDKSLIMWYNSDVKRRVSQKLSQCTGHRSKEANEKNF